ncbi:hypothetical protein ACQ4PT_039344 [Festuca glaucescens]
MSGAGDPEVEGRMAAAGQSQGGGSGGAPTEPRRAVTGEAAAAQDSARGPNPTRAGVPVAEMMARLRLTAVEATAVVLDDEEDADLVDPDLAMVGKVLSPNLLHIETIKAAMRPAWGNPRGLVFNSAGDNLFVAEFGSNADRERVIDGSPWRVGKHAVLMQRYDADIKPPDVKFTSLTLWARIYALPPRLMRVQRGEEIAKPVGRVLRIEADDLGRCWGGFMRLRVEVNVTEPLMRMVTVYSSKFKTTEAYEVKYERLPFFCYSCGLLGHSHLLCPNPAAREEDGSLPYATSRLCVDEEGRKASGTKSGHASSSAGAEHFANNSKASSGGSSHPGKGKATAQNGLGTDGEVTSPAKGGRGAGRGRGRSARGRGRAQDEAIGRELFPSQNPKRGAAGLKRKSAKDPKFKSGQLIKETVQPVLALMPSKKAGTSSAMDVQKGETAEEVLSNDSNKKQRTQSGRSTDLAEADMQPRQTQ